MHIKKIDKFHVLKIYELVCSYFVIYLGFLFVKIMNPSAQKRLFTVKMLKACLLSWPIFCPFPQIITVIKALIYYKDYLTTLPLHCYCINIRLLPCKVQ